MRFVGCIQHLREAYISFGLAQSDFASKDNLKYGSSW